MKYINKITGYHILSKDKILVRYTPGLDDDMHDINKLNSQSTNLSTLLVYWAKNNKIGKKRFELLKVYYYWVYSSTLLANKGTFLKTYRIWTYIIAIKSHMFCLLNQSLFFICLIVITIDPTIASKSIIEVINNQIE